MALNCFHYHDIARYALTLRIMLVNLRRKVGLTTGTTTPISSMGPGPHQTESMVLPPPSFVDPTGVQPPFTLEELGFPWSNQGHGSPANFSPSDIPLWLQEQVRFRPVSVLPCGAC